MDIHINIARLILNNVCHIRDVCCENGISIRETSLYTLSLSLIHHIFLTEIRDSLKINNHFAKEITSGECYSSGHYHWHQHHTYYNAADNGRDIKASYRLLGKSPLVVTLEINMFK